MGLYVRACIKYYFQSRRQNCGRSGCKLGPLHEAEGGRAPHDLSPHLEEFAVTAICSDCGGDGSQGGVASGATPPDGVAVWVRCGFAVGSLHISVDRSIYPRPGIDDRTGPENLEVERRKKTGSKVAI